MTGNARLKRTRAFTLHGLWPQNIKGWPQDCRMPKRPWVPQVVIDDMRDIMPSKNLVIHEYRAHGTCSGLEPDQYFGLARDLYERVSIPPRFSGTEGRRDLTQEDIEAEFLKANRWLKPNMIVVSRRGEELLDVRDMDASLEIVPVGHRLGRFAKISRMPSTAMPSAYSACSFCSTHSLTGVTLVAPFLGFFALCAMLVEWWNSTWRVAVEPVRSEVYGARMIPSPCFHRSWRSSGCRVT